MLRTKPPALKKPQVNGADWPIPEGRDPWKKPCGWCGGSGLGDYPYPCNGCGGSGNGEPIDRRHTTVTILEECKK